MGFDERGETRGVELAGVSCVDDICVRSRVRRERGQREVPAEVCGSDMARVGLFFRLMQTN